MNIGIDIRPMMAPNRTGVGEYTLELLNAVFALDKNNKYFLFYNSYKDVSDNIPWNYNPLNPPARGDLPENVHIAATRYPNKLFNAGIKFFGRPKLDKLSLRAPAKGRGNPIARDVILSEAKNPPELQGMFRSSQHDNISQGIASPAFAGVNLASRPPRNDKLDIFFSPNPNFTSVGLNTKFVLTIHDLSFEFFPEFFSIKQRLWHKAVNPRKQCERADLILTPSENTKRDIADYYKIPPEKIKVIYPGLSPMLKEKILNIEILNITRKKYALPENYILFLGTVEHRKNIIGLIKAFEIFNTRLTFPHPPQGGISLIISGSPGYGCEEIKKYAENSPCKDKIKFIGYIGAEHKPALYAGAKLFVYPSFYEGFGFPVLEAMAAGAPVITSNRSSLPEITGSTAYLINPNNPAEIAAAMAELLSAEPADYPRNYHKKNGLARAADFTWQKTAESWLNVIRTIV